LQIDTTRDEVLLDAKVNIPLYARFKLSLGQQKIPFSADALTSSTKKDLTEAYYFLDRVLPGCSRDIGAILHGSDSNEYIKADFGVFNGNGINNTANDNDNFLYVSRMSVSPFKKPGPDFNVGISGAVSKDVSGNSREESALLADPSFAPYKRELLGADIQFKTRSFLLGGELIAGRFNPDELSLNEADFAGWGVTIGQFIVKDILQCMARYEEFDPDTDVDNVNDIRWITLGLNFFADRNIKLQVNYIFKEEEINEIDNDCFVAQMQYLF